MYEIYLKFLIGIFMSKVTLSVITMTDNVMKNIV